jgi:transcriptional regulator with XRE-family HTH domain
MAKRIRDSKWIKDADYRIINKRWLKYSSNIARRILAGIKDKQDIDPTVNQDTLAADLGVTPQYISKVVKGKENLSLKTIAKISDALGVELILFPEYRYSSSRMSQQTNPVYTPTNALIIEWFKRWCDKRKVNDWALLNTTIQELLKDFYNSIIPATLPASDAESKDWREECERLAKIAEYWQQEYYKVVPPRRNPKIDNL